MNKEIPQSGTPPEYATFASLSSFALGSSLYSSGQRNVNRSLDAISGAYPQNVKIMSNEEKNYFSTITDPKKMNEVIRAECRMLMKITTELWNNLSDLQKEVEGRFGKYLEEIVGNIANGTSDAELDSAIQNNFTPKGYGILIDFCKWVRKNYTTEDKSSEGLGKYLISHALSEDEMKKIVNEDK